MTLENDKDKHVIANLLKIKDLQSYIPNGTAGASSRGRCE